MRDETSLKRQIIRYVTGELNEEERQEIEQMYFSDPQFLSEVEAVTDDLVDDYLRGEMAGDVRLQFEQLLRVNPTLRERVAFSRTLLHLIDATARPVSEPRRSFAAGLWTNLAAMFSWRLLPATAIATAIITLCGLWYMTSRQTAPQPTARLESSPSPSIRQEDRPGLTTSPSAVQAPARSDGPPQTLPRSISPRPLSPRNSPSLATFFLPVDVVRGDENKPEFPVPSQTQTIALQLELPNGAAGPFQVALQTRSGEIIQRWDNLTVQRQQTTPVVTLKLPASRLKATDYVVTLSRLVSGGSPVTIHNYLFSIVRSGAGVTGIKVGQRSLTIQEKKLRDVFSQFPLSE
ncbi:MAG: hypothetical protein U0Z53_09370 [Blastocatellia bacterium]